MALLWRQVGPLVQLRSRLLVGPLVQLRSRMLVGPLV